MITPQFPIRITQLVQLIIHAIMPKYQDQALCTQYAWWMLQALTQQKKTELITAPEISLSANQLAQLNNWIDAQVKKNMPLAYLLGSVPFANTEILVEPPILIPRQETEEWCLDLITMLKKINLNSFSVLDLCTGSGCIAIALANAFPQAKIFACDISPHALSLAKKNSEHNHVPTIQFLQSDLFENLRGVRVDIIISNPPYIAAQELSSLDPSVREWEDPGALIAPDHGLAIIQRIIRTARAHILENDTLKLYDIPQLWIEIGYKQGQAVAELMHSAGFDHVQIKKDLHGNDRVVTGCITHGSSHAE